jgi:hypothetical protein
LSGFAVILPFALADAQTTNDVAGWIRLQFPAPAPAGSPAMSGVVNALSGDVAIFSLGLLFTITGQALAPPFIDPGLDDPNGSVIGLIVSQRRQLLTDRRSLKRWRKRRMNCDTIVDRTTPL